MCGGFSPIFHFGPLYRAEGQVYICVTDCKADVAFKDNYCFPKVSAIKYIMHSLWSWKEREKRR